jgi:hypothetical protein
MIMEMPAMAMKALQVLDLMVADMVEGITDLEESQDLGMKQVLELPQTPLKMEAWGREVDRAVVGVKIPIMKK